MPRLLTLLSLAWVALAVSASALADDRPNVVLIFTDDQGYGDVGCYGAEGFKTPHTDKLASQGMRFTDFYVGCPVCSGSRTSLLTGCHYQRLSVPAVMFPGNKNGLNPDEITIAEVLKPLGYSTAIVGKWHLGHREPFLPMQQGFDDYYGIPYSNDMSIDPATAVFAEDVTFREGMTAEKAKSEKPKRNWVPLMRGGRVIEYPADQTTLTKRYTEEAVRYIKEHKDGPFFLYLPHTMPHLPMAVSKEFKGRTRSLFGDVMEEIDWSVGQIMQAIDEAGIADNTLVIFTTDNGTRSGSSGPLRGRKAQVYEGGIRVPCIMRWPGKIPAGATCAEVAATIDVLPTLAAITGGKLPEQKIDGKDIRPLMLGESGAKSPHEFYILAHGGGAVRSGPWKFYPWAEGSPNRKRGKAQTNTEAKAGDRPAVQLYDLSKDLGEQNNVAAANPEVVERLRKAYAAHAADIKQNKRPAGK